MEIRENPAAGQDAGPASWDHRAEPGVLGAVNIHKVGPHAERLGGSSFDPGPLPSLRRGAPVRPTRQESFGRFQLTYLPLKGVAPPTGPKPLFILGSASLSTCFLIFIFIFSLLSYPASNNFQDPARPGGPGTGPDAPAQARSHWSDPDQRLISSAKEGTTSSSCSGLLPEFLFCPS